LTARSCSCGLRPSGGSLQIEGVLDVPLDELSRAHAGGLADLMH
jgi:hypothetical protein